MSLSPDRADTIVIEPPLGVGGSAWARPRHVVHHSAGLLYEDLPAPADAAVRCELTPVRRVGVRRRWRRSRHARD